MVYLFYFYFIILWRYIFWVRPSLSRRWFYAGESHDIFGGSTNLFDTNKVTIFLEKKVEEIIS